MTTDIINLIGILLIVAAFSAIACPILWWVLPDRGRYVG